MSGGLDLQSAPAAAPRRRGRPPGSTNKRARDQVGYIAAMYGATAAQQLAALCMVKPAELRAAGGNMAKAVVAKALELVQHVRAAQAGRDEWLRQVVREELEAWAIGRADNERQAAARLVEKIREATSGFGLREALAMMDSARRDLMPYTDQRQPLAVDMQGKGLAPSAVIMSVEKVDVLVAGGGQVSQRMSHAEHEGVEIPRLLDLGPTD